METLCRFGVVADVQYGNFPNGTNYRKTRQRFYKIAVDIWTRALDTFSRCPVDLVLQLGDIIDGRNASLGCSQQAMSDVVKPLDNFSVPVLHCIGNHELYNFSRPDLLSYLPFPKMAIPFKSPEHSDAYAYSVDFRNADKTSVVFIVLDTYEFACLGSEKGFGSGEAALKAKEFLVASRNTDPNGNDLNDPDCLRGYQKRLCAFNGAVSASQLAWLDDLLTTADSQKSIVIISAHEPVYPKSCDLACLVWNYTDILSVIDKHKSVVAFFAGHCHEGGYAVSPTGVHHVTMQGVIESKPENADCFAIVNVFCDRLEICGYGSVPSRTCHFIKD